MTATRAQSLALSKSWLGRHEDPPGSNRCWVTSWFGIIGPWCAMMQSLRLYTLGFRYPGAQTPKGWASADMMYRYWKNKGWLTTHPEPGDLVFFHFPGEHAGCNHVGEFLSWPSPSQVKTRDGNTSGTNPTDGGMVADMTRSRSYVLGYGKVAFAPPSSAPVTKPATWWVRTLMLTSPYQHGPDVSACQKRLVAAGHSPGKVDGIYGTSTVAAVKAFQKAKNLKVDGVVGATTAHALGG